MLSSEEIELTKMLGHLVGAVRIEAESLKSFLDGQEVTAKLEELISTFDKRYEDFAREEAALDNYDSIARRASAVATYAIAIAQNLSSLIAASPELFRMRDNLSAHAQRLQTSIQDRKITFTRSNVQPELSNNNSEWLTEPINYAAPSELANQNSKSNVHELSAKLSRLQEELNQLEKRNQLVDQSLDGASTQLSSLMLELPDMQQRVDEKLQIVKDLLDFTEAELSEKNKKVDGLVSVIAKKVVAGDYEDSAAAEKSAADVLRIASLACMGLIGITVIYSFYETTVSAFEWETSLFRLIFSAVLSVPAAYLARESAKHRSQQYAHLQMALDLKAIDPYLASVPEDDRNRLKVEMASRIFGNHERGNGQQDSYPINAQELILAIIEKLDFKSNKERRTD